MRPSMLSMESSGTSALRERVSVEISRESGSTPFDLQGFRSRQALVSVAVRRPMRGTSAWALPPLREMSANPTGQMAQDGPEGWATVTL